MLNRAIKKIGSETVARYLGCTQSALANSLSYAQTNALKRLDAVIRFGTVKALRDMLAAHLDAVRLLPAGQVGVFIIDGHPLVRLRPSHGTASISLLDKSIQQTDTECQVEVVISTLRNAMLARCSARGYAMSVLDAIQEEKSLLMNGLSSQAHFKQCELLRQEVRSILTSSLAENQVRQPIEESILT